ncbi:unnamed protein product [Brassica napus]|uniref:(rape) hypothetical protein n=1 Tax=Brassica napus TaxID=3708 RepID=A0A816NVF2_BRANA|nr:unnamed protein product [Brassica napus]
MADGENIQPFVCDNGTRMVKLAPFDPTNKKKKKVVILEPIEDSTESHAEKSDSLPANWGFENSLSTWDQWAFATVYILQIPMTSYLHSQKGEDEHGDLKPAFITDGGN